MTAEDKRKVLSVLDGLMEGTSGVVRATILACKCAVDEMEVEEKWIPVAERLPKCGERVLATDGGFVGEFYINKRGQWQRYNVNDYSLLMALDILYWMPLPEPPKDGTR